MLIVMILGWAFTYGKIVQKTTSIEKDLNELEIEVDRKIAYCDSHFVNAERYNECVEGIKRRLNEINAIGLNSRLSRIEALLDSIQITLSK